jgi:hypothetical protein
MSFVCQLCYQTGTDDYKQITIDCTNEGMLLEEIDRLFTDKVYYIAIRQNSRTILSLRKENSNSEIITKYKEWLERRQDKQIYELIEKFNAADIGYNLSLEGIGFLSDDEYKKALKIAKELNLSHLV